MTKGEKNKARRERYESYLGAKKRPSKAEQIAAIPIEDIAKLSGESGRQKLLGYVKSLQYGYKRRVQQFKRRGESSYAQIALEKSMPAGGQSVKLTKLTRNQLILEFARYSKFFTAKTSTLEGIREENQLQDARIFGIDDEGNPRHQMSRADREKFWDLYYEYYNTYRATATSYGSETVQQQLADAIFGANNFPTDNIPEFLEEVENRLTGSQIITNSGGMGNVYSGRGDIIPE